jgi:predicted permease
MLKDVRHAVRVLLRARWWTLVVILSLALGIGANAALFSAVNRLLLKQLPVKDPNGLVRLRYAGPNDMVTSSSDYGSSRRTANGDTVRTTFSFSMFEQFVANNQTMEDLFACAPFGRVNLVVDGRADIANAFISTGNYYQVLGARARVGRTIVPDDDKPAAPPVAVISSRYWTSRFANDAGVVGKAVQINNVPVTIVGVLSPEFIGVQQTIGNAPDIAVPLAFDQPLNFMNENRVSQPTYWWLQVMGRLRPGVTAAQVQGNLEGTFQSTARAGFDSYLSGITEQERGMLSNRNRTQIPRLLVDTGRRGVYDVNENDSRSITILSVVVAMVLLIVCANVANLLLSRATTRYRELSVRLSLGATRFRLIRQLLTESLLLAAVGGGLGILVGYWGQQLLPGPHGEAAPPDWRLLAFVIGLTGLTGVVFGIAPALRATSVNVNDGLKATSRGVVGGRSVLSKALLIVQVAVSLVLLVGAGLFLRTLQNLRHVDVGFDTQNLALFRINPQLNRYDEKRSLALYRDVLDRLVAIPGVRAAAFSQPALLSGSVNSSSIYVQGRTYASRSRDSINRLVVSPNFFEAMGMPLRTGRGFTMQDHETAPKVVVINETAARKFFPDQNPLGQRFGHSAETTGQMEIVGVLRDAKYSSVRDPAPPTMYVSYLQSRTTNPVMAVRTAGDPRAAVKDMRTVISQIDPNLPLMDVSTQVEQVEQRFTQEKLFAQAYTLFGGIAMLLAAIGLFGLMSYNVSRRTNEIGIRMALGAQRGDVLRLVLRESMILVAAGVAIGIAAALGAGRFVATLLFGLQPTDMLTLAGAIAAMVAVSALAGYLPARRAARVDPMVALRYD